MNCQHVYSTMFVNENKTNAIFFQSIRAIMEKTETSKYVCHETNQDQTRACIGYFAAWL